MTGTSSAVQPPSRRPSSVLTALVPRRHVRLAAGGVVVALVLGALLAAPRDVQGADPSGPFAAAAEREVVTPDAGLTAQLGALTLRSASGGSRSRTTAVPAHVVSAPASSRPVLRPGDRGAAVATLQQRLRVKATGWYGPLTLVAVVAFQKSRGLPAQGYVGPATWRALLTPPPRTRTVPAVAAARTVATVTAGRVCPAPGAAFGEGWGAARAGHLHQGMDLVARRGTPILAVEDGIVIREGRQSNGALRIVLQGRSGSKFFYGHMSRDLVHAGSRVRRGQVIGLMGDTGSPGQVHLHFEYWRSGGESAAVDPAPLLRSLC